LPSQTRSPSHRIASSFEFFSSLIMPLTISATQLSLLFFTYRSLKEMRLPLATSQF
jgi:hypothetical protein